MKHELSDISALPLMEDFCGRLQSLAMLDAILMPEWEMRYFSFNSKWAPGEMMGSMRDGQGSEFFFLFGPAGVAGKIYCAGEALGTAAESALAQIPREFSSFLGEPAFSLKVATCYLWRRCEDSVWSIAPRGRDGVPLQAFVADEGEYYRAWAEGYYEVDVDADSVRDIFKHRPVTEELVRSLNPEADMHVILADAREIGYGDC